MTIIETNKYLIFSCDELRVEIEKVIKWYNDYDGPGVRTRHVDETGYYKNHYREICVPWNQLMGNKKDDRGNVINMAQESFRFWREMYGRNLTPQETEYEISQSLLGGESRNRWGEPKIFYDGDPQITGSWYIWADDLKTEKDVRRGDKETYKMTPALAQFTRRIVGDDDDQYPLETYHFDRDAVPEDLHIKTNLYLVCDKAYLKQEFEKPASFMGLTTRDDGKEVIRIVDNYVTIQQIVAQDNGATSTTENNTNNNPPNNNDIQQYNDQITKKLEDFQHRIYTLCTTADEIIGFLVGIGAENSSEATTQINLIFAPQILPTLKELLTGDGGDVARQTENLNIETRNTQIIDNWENNFKEKQTALAELRKIKDKLSNSDASPNPNNPDSQTPKDSNNNSPNSPPLNPNSQKPANPIVENNQKSEENIKDISNIVSLNEARQKSKQEINNLLDRYGIKSNELNSTLWSSQTNWETYLATLTKIEQIVDLVKKMKMAIIQQSNQNNQANQMLPLPQLRKKVIKEIEDLLKKHPQIKGEKLLKGKNWKEKISRLDNPQRILALARQLREEIVFSQNNSRGNSPTDSSPTGFPVFIIPIGLGVVGIALLLLIIRRYKKSRKNYKVRKIGK